MKAASLDQVRSSIDVIDRKIVALVTERETWVREAARFKTTRSEVEAPARVEQVIERVRGLAEEAGGSPEVVERLYRAMIAAFIDLEHTERNRIAQLPAAEE
jgi:isochorismate pyruvate lyase